jgi:two-component system CheB/CheR fusion protein
MLAMFLELEGFEVRTAYDGLQALEVAAQLQPQVVFLDLGMPRLDGFQTARRIRQLPGCAKVTLIALTGWGQDSDRRRTKEAGFDYHLVKPIEPRMLREMLANLPLEQKGMVIPASEADG